jgi:hypothetical protein
VALPVLNKEHVTGRNLKSVLYCISFLSLCGGTKSYFFSSAADNFLLISGIQTLPEMVPGQENHPKVILPKKKFFCSVHCKPKMPDRQLRQ